jgi:predicted NAD-dependent protein-ADP-ribosyltransferase YbiA (DUF1768 family)
MSALRIPVIDTFAGEYLFLSNFAAAPTPHRGWLYPASEHAFAAAKTRDADCRDPRHRRSSTG